MKRIIQLSMVIATTSIYSCNGNGSLADASGTFEADEVIVSSLATGRILSLKIDEGSVLKKDSIVGLVDPTLLDLQKQEIEATILSLDEKTATAEPQVKLLEDQLVVQQSKLDNLLFEKTRIENLLKKDAATGKQLDDINAAIDVVKKEMNVTRQQINVQKNNVGTQNRSGLHFRFL